MDLPVGDIVERDDLVDPEARRRSTLLELAPAVEMHLHSWGCRGRSSGDRPGRSAARGPAAELPNEPAAALGIAQVEPEVVDVQGQPSAGAEDAERFGAGPCCLRGRPRIIPSVLNIERA